MNTNKDSVMLAELAANLPKGFPKALARMIGSVYVSAWNECKELRLGAWEKENVFPILRRAMIETELRQLAERHSVEHESHILSQTTANSYTKFRSGRIVFSVHHVDLYMGPLPRFAHYRNQNSVVNLHVEQFMLFTDHIDRDQPIYVYIVHSTNPDNKHQLGEIQVAVPASERMDSVCSYEIADLIRAQEAGKPRRTDQSDDDIDIRPLDDEQAAE
jgi:hypothetical protein